MADELRIGLSELLRKAMIEQDASFLKEGVRLLSQALMEMEVEEHVGASRHERSPARTGQRNGYRQRDWDMRVGSVELRVPRARDSSCPCGRLVAEVPGALHEERPLFGVQGGPADGGAAIRTVFAQPEAKSAREQ
jgi:Transposase, Mutator family